MRYLIMPQKSRVIHPLPHPLRLSVDPPKKAPRPVDVHSVNLCVNYDAWGTVQHCCYRGNNRELKIGELEVPSCSGHYNPIALKNLHLLKPTNPNRWIKYLFPPFFSPLLSEDWPGWISFAIFSSEVRIVGNSPSYIWKMKRKDLAGLMSFAEKNRLVWKRFVIFCTIFLRP